MTICGECGQRVKLEGPQTVSELEAEMAQVDDLMKRLSTHRSGLRQRINSLAAISRLPPEILLYIFSLTCQSPPTTPLFFGSICTSWRLLAWSTPTLWSTITLRITHPHAKSEAQLHLLWEWLLRAGTLPLQIKLFATEEDDFTFASFRSVMQVLVQRSEYWGSIECLLPPQCHDILSMNHRYPRLTKVLFRPPKGTISTFNQPPDMFAGAPLVEDVDLSGYDFSSMFLPWEQLRRFRTQFLTVTECVRVLEQCPNLTQCYLDNVYFPDNHPSPMLSDSSHLVHSDLLSPDLRLVKGAGTLFLDAVSLPALTELRLDYMGTENVPLLPVISLVSRSACKLRSLSVTRTMFAEEDLIRCLEAIPTLEELHVGVPEIMHTMVIMLGVQGLSDAFTSQLCGVAGSKCLFLPQLKMFSYEGIFSCSWVGLVDALERRWRCSEEMGVAKLECAKVKARGTFMAMSVRETARLAQLSNGGMQLYVPPFRFSST